MWKLRCLAGAKTTKIEFQFFSLSVHAEYRSGEAETNLAVRLNVSSSVVYSRVLCCPWLERARYKNSLNKWLTPLVRSESQWVVESAVCVCLICRKKERRAPIWSLCFACLLLLGRCLVWACWTHSSIRFLKHTLPLEHQTHFCFLFASIPLMICVCLLWCLASRSWRTTWSPSPGCCLVWTPCPAQVSSVL